MGFSFTSLSCVCGLPSSNSIGLFNSATPPPSLQPRFIRVSCSSSSSPQLSLSAIHNNTLSQIHNSGVIACLRANNAELAMEAAYAALSAGISVLEIVMSTPGVFEVLRQLVQDHPTAVLGVGTVLKAKDAKNAINSGAKFLMSPAMVKDIMDVVKGGEVLYIPGVMTPTEILFAYDAGAKIVKVYPVSALGGIQYISALKKPFSHIPMVASQGITIDSIGEYIARGASSVVLSDAIFSKEAMVQNNIKEIYQLARLAAVQGSEAVQRLIYDERLVFHKVPGRGSITKQQNQASSMCTQMHNHQESESYFNFLQKAGEVELESYFKFRQKAVKEDKVHFELIVLRVANSFHLPHL